MMGDKSVFVIAHHGRLQKYFDTKGIRYGVQWQIARLVTIGHITYEDVAIPELDKLKGPNQFAAPLVDNLYGGNRSETDEVPGAFFRGEREATSPWKELDREYEHVNSLERFHRHSDGWYGGRVHFTALLKSYNNASKSVESSNYKIILNRAELGPSTRLSRQFGSYAIIRIRISRKVMNKARSALITFFSQRFLLCGIVYRAFYAKDSSVFLGATNELFESLPCLPRHAYPPPPSFMEFLDWHNPIQLNSSQSISKWASRFALGLSNSVPGIDLDFDSILPVDDIVACDSVMTDGCGFISLTAMKKMCAIFHWDACPTAIQCRIAGAKGLLIIHPDTFTNDSDVPRVWLRPSQIKIKYPITFPLPKARVTIDVLRSSHLRCPSHLSAEIIVNLADNGVPYEVFLDLTRENLDDIVDNLLAWDGPTAMFELWCHVAQAGGVIAARKAREAAGEARMRGLSERDEEEEDEDDLESFGDSPQSTAWWADDLSGCPSSIGETILVMLDAGFTPQNCPFLADKIKNFARSSVKAYLKAPQVGNPYGVLAPDEVQILARDSKFPQPDGTVSHFIVGDVLLARYPCKLPTDVQKVKAVVKSELSNYVDVIVCPIQGSRRFADILAGGDYDGDKAIAIWQPTIVGPFRNAPLCHSFPPNDLLNNFSKESCTMSDLIKEHGLHPSTMEARIQSFLLGGLQSNAQVGRYSNFHDVAIYTLGYNHKETIRFAMFLTAAKSGLIVLPEVLQRDAHKFQRRAPSWKETEEETTHEQNELNVSRPHTLREFIMDAITREAKCYSNIKLSKVQSAVPEATLDTTLLKPWDNAKERVARMQLLDQDHAARMDLELSRIQAHVEGIFPEYKAKVSSSFTTFKIERRQDILRGLTRQFARNPTPECLCFSEDELARLKASYAYKIDPEGKFPFCVAMRDMGYIKARSQGPSKAVSHAFYDKFAIKKSFFR
ncbi:RNA dependent RNA polymerase-domain-containing protein [Pisolithus marmoratus]|nr:RNA dependent RNA polymerase-domain-containing protein [Pisolithus marmoratus]